MAWADRDGIRSLAQRVLKRAAATADRLRPPKRGVVVLIYHRVGGGSGLELDLPAGRFDEQMAALAGRVVTLDVALDAFSRSPDPRPTGDRGVGDPVVVTFDDGTADFADAALPVLVRHGIPVTLYLATGFVEDQVEFPDGGRPLSWNALRDARETGLVTVGSHTHTHLLLDRAAPATIAVELDTSCGLIEERLGAPAHDFAYPKAVAGSADAELAVRARFRSAALAGTRPNAYGATDPYRLARSPIQVGDGMRWFRAKAAGGMTLEDDLRRVLNKWRYSGVDR